MTEYIERDVVIDDIGDLFTICYETLPNECGHHFIVEKELQTHLDFVRNLPAADVVQVVRCKDCKYWAYEKDLDASVCVMHSISGWRRIMPETAYCSMGVRKEG